MFSQGLNSHAILVLTAATVKNGLIKAVALSRDAPIEIRATINPSEFHCGPP